MKTCGTDRNIRVLVSGASVAGLTTAYWLGRYGFDVTVVERASFLRRGGQALDIRGPALEVAARMGILDDLRSEGTKLLGASVVNADGHEIHRTTDRSYTGGRFESSDIEVPRDNLCRVLYKAAASRATYVFTDWITAIEQDADGVNVRFSASGAGRFDIVIGADGLYSGVRRLCFGPDEDYLRFTGQNIAVFSAPNYMALDRWEVMHMDEGKGGLVLATDKDKEALVYLGFLSPDPIPYDHRDVKAQKQLIADRFENAGWEFSRLVEQMRASSDFYFYQTSQVRLDHWSRGRVALVGDAGYSISPASGQGTSIAMVGAYVLAGELAANKNAPLVGLKGYESQLHDYVTRNLNIALALSKASQQEPTGSEAAQDDPLPNGIPDFDKIVQPLKLKDYGQLEPCGPAGPSKNLRP